MFSMQLLNLIIQYALYLKDLGVVNQLKKLQKQHGILITPTWARWIGCQTRWLWWGDLCGDREEEKRKHENKSNSF